CTRDARQRFLTTGYLGRSSGPDGGCSENCAESAWWLVIRNVQLLESYERNELCRAEVHSCRDGKQQHRQLQPYLTCSERRRSGDGFRSRRGYELLSRDRRNGCHPPLGIERPGNASHLLPSSVKRSAERRALICDRPAPYELGSMGGYVGRSGRWDRYRVGERYCARDHCGGPRAQRVH